MVAFLQERETYNYIVQILKFFNVQIFNFKFLNKLIFHILLGGSFFFISWGGRLCTILVSMATETAIQDPRKHALEALKRRFAFVEADLLQQKNKKSIKEGDGKETHRTTSLADKTDAAVTPSFDAQHKKGIF